MKSGAERRKALAEKIRSEHRQSERQRQLVTVGLSVVVVVAILGVFAWFKAENLDDADAFQTPENATEDYGFRLTPELLNGSLEAEDEQAADPQFVDVLLYEDFLCYSCRIFHETSSEFLTEKVRSGDISLTYHPFTFMLTQSTNEYSQRAANAAACVADASGVVAYAAMHGLLFEAQPQQGGAG